MQKWLDRSVSCSLFGEKNTQHKSSAECRKVVSDIFGEIEFSMEYKNIGLYAYCALFSKLLVFLFPKY